MVHSKEFIKKSLEINLFFARIMKEHALFIEAAFLPNNLPLIQIADEYKRNFSNLLYDTIILANGNISNEALESGEIVTPYTLNAELATQFFTSIPINTNLTIMEHNLVGELNFIPYYPNLEQQVFMLNQRAIAMANDIANFKFRILNDVLACRLFTYNYPLLLEHIRREALFYANQLTKLQNGDIANTPQETLEFEVFWDRIMAEHSKFIRGLLDPTENELFKAANNFANKFDELTEKTEKAIERPSLLPQITAKNLEATKEIRDFKAQGTRGLLNCNIKSIIAPLLGDHVLREANHYLRILNIICTKED